MRVHWCGKSANERYEYACQEDFVSLFESERLSLQRLALLLTVNSQSARRCLMGAFRDCIACSSVSKEWVLSWTRRMVVRNAIRLVMGTKGQSSVTEDDADGGSVPFFQDDSRGAIEESGLICNLPELDRFVFVMCILERYSTHDCALLLARSLREISEAQRRVEKLLQHTGGLRDLSRCFAMP